MLADYRRDTSLILLNYDRHHILELTSYTGLRRKSSLELATTTARLKSFTSLINHRNTFQVIHWGLRVIAMLCDMCIEMLGRCQAPQEHDIKFDRQATSRQDREGGKNDNFEGREKATETPAKVLIDGILDTVTVTRGHHRSSSSLYFSVAAGCHICEPFWVHCCTHDRIKKPDNIIASDVVGTIHNRMKDKVSSEEFLTHAMITAKSPSMDSTLSLRFNEDLVDFEGGEHFYLMTGTCALLYMCFAADPPSRRIIGS